MHKPIKIIDLFAGPGGLGEGFSALQVGGRAAFRIGVSVEKEASAHATLTLRAFFRQFPLGKAPSDYYAYLRGDITKQKLFNQWPKQATSADIETLKGPRALGEDNELIDRAISASLEKHEPWVLIGGPPCQAYSLVGRARNKGVKGYKAEEDHRHFLYKEYLRIIAKFQPTVFVMENVKGMLSTKVNGKPIFTEILSDLQNPSKIIKDQPTRARYRVYSLSTAAGDERSNPDLKPADFVIRAEEFGIPQTRHRVILLGIREDLAIEGKQLVLERSSAPSTEEMIGRMPPLRSGLSKEPDSPESWLRVRREILNELANALKTDRHLGDKVKELTRESALPSADRGKRFIPFDAEAKPYEQLSNAYRSWFHDDQLSGYLNHESRGHMRQDLARYLYCAAFAKHSQRSPRLNDFPESLLPNHANNRSGSFVDRFKVQMSHKPASTITSHISKDGHYFIHYDPDQCRSLTVREAARIQTFPDNYLFEGNRTQQYVQVGNAVPPVLAYKIAKIVYELFN